VELVGKLVVRREKKGRGGKTATVIDGLQLRGPSLAALAQRLRRELGCGSHVEDSRIVISGSQAERVAAWLRSLGAKTVILGN
jgi:translation initiation factor 1